MQIVEHERLMSSKRLPACVMRCFEHVDWNKMSPRIPCYDLVPTFRVNYTYAQRQYLCPSVSDSCPFCYRCLYIMMDYARIAC